ncbi:hypothetical protein MKO06_07805 [Gramella sp. GC03-9]|uniref:Uncharacterized protein n=1 Tax=Christiangramia oceanisediminis TaxID=2920386 RepID=A0A9X2I221_9FLAO|nr:hypothetical protein [Gramella oceanisediminis]MCP9199804.1 hypothetical protein [Gramella oceanisediminis]
MLEFLIEEKFYHLIFELLAAIAGLIYLRKSVFVEPQVKIFIYYLCYIVFIEYYALLPIYAWLTDYESLSFYEDSVFRTNNWYGNLNLVINTICFSQIFIRSLSSKTQRKILYYGLAAVLIISVVRLASAGIFFSYTDSYVSALQTFFIFLSVCFWYFEILKSNKIINFYSDVKFFISVAIVLWTLLKTPLDIYSKYNNLDNEAFRNLDIEILRYMNIFMYSIYILGFYADYRLSKEPSPLKT